MYKSRYLFLESEYLAIAPPSLIFIYLPANDTGMLVSQGFSIWSPQSILPKGFFEIIVVCYFRYLQLEIASKQDVAYQQSTESRFSEKYSKGTK